jgi:hypothetical protein
MSAKRRRQGWVAFDADDDCKSGGLWRTGDSISGWGATAIV